jgi:formylglycine-generating enzyme required for sulfatase activity
MGTWRGLAIAVLAGAPACFLDFGGLTGGAGADAGDASAVSDVAAESTGAACAPSMVKVDAPGGAFCIDATEVTNAQYQDFLDAAVFPPGAPAFCAGNTLTPATWPSSQPTHPVATVDWCDAWSFCAWTHKRLCGAIGGGSGSTSTANDAARSEWLYACTGGDANRKYPYGPSYIAGDCVVNTAGPAVAGSVASCEGAAPGVFDLSGNVEEWTDECAPGDSSSCLARGGSFADDDPTRLTCASITSGASSLVETWSDRAAFRGFRCCSSPR